MTDPTTPIQAPDEPAPSANTRPAPEPTVPAPPEPVAAERIELAPETASEAPAPAAAPEPSIAAAAVAAEPAPAKAARSPFPKFPKGSFEALLSRLRSQNVVRFGRPALASGALLLALSAGFGAGRLTHKPSSAPDQPYAGALASLGQLRDDTTHLRTEVKAVKTALDTLKAERARADLASKVDKLGADLGVRTAKLAEGLDRVEKTQRDPSRIASLHERLDRIEKQVGTSGTAANTAVAPAPAPASVPVAAATPTPPPKPVATAPATEVTQTGSIGDAKTAAKPSDSDPRKSALDGWHLRDLDEGDYALVENRQGRLFEVAPGTMLPGIGRVEAIERRGRRWVVITPKGYIAER